MEFSGSPEFLQALGMIAGRLIDFNHTVAQGSLDAVNYYQRPIVHFSV